MVKRKLQVLTDNSSWEAPKKVRKPRKPMTEKQRVAAAKRLEKAREARAAKNPEYGMSGIHESLRDLPDDHFISPVRVKQWIKTQKDIIKTERANVRLKMKGAVAALASHEGYVRNMNKYLRDGDWVDDFYGEYMDKKINIDDLITSYKYLWTQMPDNFKDASRHFIGICVDYFESWSVHNKKMIVDMLADIARADNVIQDTEKGNVNPDKESITNLFKV